MPTSVYVPVWLASMRTLSPIAKFSFLAVPASITTSSSPFGARPSLILKGDSVPRPEADPPKLGAIWLPTNSPSFPTIGARPCT